MKNYGARNPTENTPVFSSIVQNVLLSAATAQAFDWPTAAGATAGANAAAAPTGMVTITFLSSATATGTGVWFHPYTTGAALPTSGLFNGSSQAMASIPPNQRVTFQVPGDSTGWSVYGQSSGYVTAEYWKK
jgi:hypothetical protein